MKLRNMLLAATVLAAPVAAKAEVVNGVYVAGGAGGTIMQDETIERLGFPQARSTVSLGNLGGSTNGVVKRFDAGFVGVGSVGYGFGNGVRVEVEGNYRQNGVDSVGIGNAQTFSNNFRRLPGTSASGQEEKYGAMVNAFYDFDLTPYGIPYVMPYVGAGVGYQHVHNQNQQIAGPGFLIRDTGNSDNLGYQGIVGAAFPLPMILPGLALTAEYRFLGLAFDDVTNGQLYSVGQSRGTRVRSRFDDNYNHSFLLGVRYAFNEAPPAPPPAAPMAPPQQAMAPARTYLVFFDWDRSDLTQRARQIIGEASQASTRVQTTRIEVNGYTDLSGTAQYNQKLSVRRAQAVAAELVRDGVPRGEISLQGFGETNPLVPTAKGVREPQNRRVEIILH